MAKRLTHKTFLSLLMMLLTGCLWAQQDTVVIRGYTFLFNHAVHYDEIVTKEVGVSRLGPGPRKWLLSHKTEELVPDCNSIRVELGGYLVGDTTITFYTAWTFGGQTWADVGVRKQVYRVARDGRVSRIQSIVSLKSDLPPCFNSIEEFMYHPNNPTGDRTIACRLFFQCIRERYDAEWIDLKDAAQLYAEVRKVLAEPLQEIYRWSWMDSRVARL